MAPNQPPNQPAGPSGGGDVPPLSPAVRKQLQRCFERAHEVLRQEKPDHDYAHTMFAECVLKDPGNLEYTEALLDNLHRKYKNNKRGSRFSGFVSKGGFKKAIAAEDWEEVFAQGIDLLRGNPWDVATLRGLAEACRARHLNETELRYLKNALDVDRKNIEVNRHCAESLARMGQFDQAIACWHRIEELDKGNIEARRKISELTIAKTRGLPGLDTTASSRPAGSPPPRPLSTGTPAAETSASAPRTSATTSKPAAAPQAGLPQAPAPQAPPTSPAATLGPRSLGDLQARVTSDPTDLTAYLQLAEAQTEAGQLREALQTLRRALEAAGGSDLSIQERLEDAQIRMIRGQVTIAEQRAEADNSQEATDLVRRFRHELNRQEMLILAARAERYPQDTAIRLELGLRLKREANYREAIKAFEAALAAPDLRAQSSLEMGECHQHLKQYGLALKCYQAAASAPPGELQQLALYRAGVLATALKHLEIAEECLVKLVKLAPDYRDAAARLDKVREIRDKG